MRKIFAVITMFFAVINIFANDTIPVQQFIISSPKPFFSPLIIDSTNVEKKKFEEKDLLKNSIDLNQVFQSRLTLSAGNDGITEYSGTESGSSQTKAFQLLAFSVDPDRYCKATLIITANDILEIYVNGKHEKTKETVEDSLQKSKPVTLELELEPRRYDVVLKRIVDAGKDRVSYLKAAIVPSKADSLAEITVSNHALRRITINDIIEGHRLSAGNSISPSGKYFIFGNTKTFPGGKSVSTLELRELTANKPLYRFPQDIRPQWVRGKDRLIYTRQGSNGRDLFTMEIPSMEEQLVAENIESGSFSLSPDGQFLLYGKTESIPADKGDVRRVLSPSDRSGSFRGRSSVYLYNFGTKVSQRLTFGRNSMVVNDISPDSRKALIMKHEENISKRPFCINTLYELDLTTLRLDTLFIDPFIRNAFYSPDGRHLLVIGSGEAFGGIGLNIAEGQISNSYDHKAFIVERKTSAVNPVTKNFNPNIDAAVWSAYDNLVYFTVEDRDRHQVYSFDPEKETFHKLELPEDMIRSFSIAEQAPVAIFQGEGTNNAYRLYSYNLKTGKSTILSDPYREQLNEMQLSKVTDWNFTSADGTVIEGRYYLPYGFDENKKYPLIVYYYGGTAPTSRSFESNYPLQVYAALGYVVYTLQPSGTTGFGQEFSARHVNAWGQRTADEIILGTQLFCREHNFADSTKTGCIGASYGGFMTQYLQTQTQIFAAAVSHAGISDISSYWGEGYWGYAYSGTASADSYPWNNPKLYTEQSPLFHADKINTPLLLLHGTADTNVPVGESVQMFNALKILGKTVEFITIDGENHHIVATEKKLAWNKTIYAWFARWLKGQPEWWNSLYPER
jgi:dipeptidyl aminopeptidase/acylaminoacyl peptidase